MASHTWGGKEFGLQEITFFDNKGFASHIHIPSGDDDLFIREVANSKNVAIAVSRSSQTLSEAKTGPVGLDKKQGI